MYTEDELCRQLKYILPDVGECGIDISVKRDEEKNKWLVRLKKNDKETSRCINDAEADMCMGNKACVGLLAEIAQFKVESS